MRRRTLIVFLALAAAGVLVIQVATTESTSPPSDHGHAPEVAASEKRTYPVTIRYPARSPGIATGLVDDQGRPVTVSCQTCHSQLSNPSSAEVLGLDTLEDFHLGLEFNHGSLTCRSCHDPEDARSFRLADGSPVERWDVMALCSQCHGPQRKDFDHGAHGGMTGYWDLTRGPRIRNACTSCHFPHSPKPGQVRPTFKPIDRFLVGSDPNMRVEREDSNHD